MKLIFEKGSPGRSGASLHETKLPLETDLPAELLRDQDAALPEVSELDVVRHFTELSRRNFGVDSGFYPLGSCTMKYNPKVCDEVCNYPGFRDLHPLLAQVEPGGRLAQGALHLIHHIEQLLSEITGMAAFTTQPMAGAHGELTGCMIIAAYHRARASRKTKIIVPDSAHGTNPASAAIAGFTVVPVQSDESGFMGIDKFRAALDDQVAGVMLTSPNTLGLFNPHIKDIADLTHKAGGLMYYDGANLNAILGKCRPGDLGFDVVHLNLHKTFATPHGMGGPGSGPVGVGRNLAPYLPGSIVEKRDDGTYALRNDNPDSIGYVAPFYGNFGILVRAYAYILQCGREGLIKVSEHAVLNANYVLSRLRSHYDVPYDRICMHECVLSATRQAKNGVRALDIAKALIDRGYHPPTIYFPLIVKEALMIEPTETESKETLDAFCDVMIELAKLAETDTEALHKAPVTTPVTRLDEYTAARDLDIASL